MLIIGLSSLLKALFSSSLELSEVPYEKAATLSQLDFQKKQTAAMKRLPPPHINIVNIELLKYRQFKEKQLPKRAAKNQSTEIPDVLF